MGRSSDAEQVSLRQTTVSEIQYNATFIGRSAPVERLFSFGGIIRSAKRNKLSDMFGTLLLLKANAVIN